MKTHAPTHRLLCKQISWLKLREFAGHVIVQIAPAGCYTPLVLHQCKRTCFRVFNKGRPHGAHVIRSQREIKNRDVNENPKMFEILWWFSHFFSTKSSRPELDWIGFNLREKNPALFMLYLHVFQRFFQQVLTKWERNARNFESKSRQIVLFWLELPPSLSTLLITFLTHTPHSSHVIENRCHLHRALD